MPERTKRLTAKKGLAKPAPAAATSDSDVDLLATAVLDQEPIENVLTRLGLTHHTYHDFLYMQIDIDPEHFFASVRATLEEMRVAEAALGELGQLKAEGKAAHPRLRRQLSRLQLPRLDAYLEWPLGAPMRYRILGRDMFDGTPYALNSYWSREQALAAAKKQLRSNRRRVWPHSGDTSSIEDCVMVEDLETGETIWDSRKDGRQS